MCSIVLESGKKVNSSVMSQEEDKKVPPAVDETELEAKMQGGNPKDDSDAQSTSTVPPMSGDDSNHNVNDRLAVLRREKRLAMNRESARLRRRRKKELISSLESQVDELSGQKNRLESTNELLTRRVQTLETELATARSTISSLVAQQSGGAMAGLTVPLQALGAASADDLVSSREVALRALLARQSQSALSFQESGLQSLDALVGNMPTAALQGLLQRPNPLISGALNSTAPTSTQGRYLPQTGAQNTLPNPHDLGSGESRVKNRAHALLLDALSSRSGGSSQAIQELLKQQQEQQSSPQHQPFMHSKFPPNFK